MESPLVVAQRAAIQEARARYERGDITVDTFRSALDSITEATAPQAVEEIIAGLPNAPHAALAAFDPAPPAPAPPNMPTVVSDGRGVSRISAFMGETRRAGRPWTLAPRARISCMMGEVVVDLRQAKLPQSGRIKVNVTMGETRILIPQGVRVTARTRVIMGEAVTLGENVAGLIASGEEEYDPPAGQQVADLHIDARVVMGELRIMVADGTQMSISELAHEVLREALSGVRDGIQQSAGQRAIDEATQRAALTPQWGPHPGGRD